MPRLIVRLESLRHNAAVVSQACVRAGASCLFVLKEAPLHPELCAALLEGGGMGKIGVVSWPGIAALPAFEQHHICSPSPMLMEATARCHTVYLSSRFSLEALHARCGARRPGLRFSLECGDGRDGMHPEEAEALASLAMRLGFELRGLSLNFACLSTKAPTLEALTAAGTVLETLKRFAPDADISAGGTDILELAEKTALPASVREIRCGTGVMLGCYPLSGRTVPGARTDTFCLEACVLEAREKEGRRLALLDFGSFHTAPEHLGLPCGSMRVCGFSSAYTVLDVTDCEHAPAEGETLGFSLNFLSLSRALASRALPLVYEG